MRLFVALDIDQQIRERIVRFVESVRGHAPDARWAHPNSLHITLKFLGEKPEAESQTIQQMLDTIHATSFPITLRGCGFFPDERCPRVFWAGIEGNPTLTSLAKNIDRALANLDVRAEAQEYRPHLTLARSRGGSGSPRRQSTDDRPHRAFADLQSRLAVSPMPEFGTMTAQEFFLFQSQLAPGGSRYTKLAAFPLR